MYELSKFSRQFLKIPYKLGSFDQNEGLDCATFVLHFFKELDGTELSVKVEEDAYNVYNTNRLSKIYESYLLRYLDVQKFPCQVEQLDILIFRERERHSEHVGIYLGGNLFIHCSEHGVQIHKLSLCKKNLLYVGRFKEGIRNGQRRK